MSIPLDRRCCLTVGRPGVPQIARPRRAGGGYSRAGRPGSGGGGLPSHREPARRVPFSAATAEAWKLIDYLAVASSTTTEQMWATLQAEFPQTYQVFTNLRIVTDGWAAVPGTENLTRFNGSPARSVPQVRDYFRDDVIPALLHQQHNFVIVDTNWPPLTVFAPLLTAVGILVVAYGLLLRWLTNRQLRRQRDQPNPPAMGSNVPGPVDVGAGSTSIG